MNIYPRMIFAVVDHFCRYQVRNKHTHTHTVPHGKNHSENIGDFHVHQLMEIFGSVKNRSLLFWLVVGPTPLKDDEVPQLVS